MENKIIIQPVSPDTFEFQDYSISDESLIVSNDLDTVFSGSTDYIEAYVYDENQNQISSQVPFTNYKITEGDVVLTPPNDLERLGFDVGSYFITYNFYRPQLSSTLNTQYYISEISSDRTEIRLDSTQIDNALLISSSLEFIAYRDTAEYFVDFLLNFGTNQLIIANNLELDLNDESNPTILIKLYEPLPATFDLKSQCSVVEQISTPQSYNVEFPPLEFTPDDFTYISGPNYSLNIKGQSGTPGMDFSYNTLVDSNLTSSFNQINNLLNRKEVNINVNYEDYNDFIYFSSAFTRLQNFYYKVGLIQSASAQLGQITSSTTGSTIYSSSQANLSQTVQDTIKNFDGYEYFLYFNSGSKYSYPKSNTEPPFTLYSTGSTEVLNWLGSTDINSAYYGGQSLSASNYDENNQNSLYYAIPEYLRSDIQNAKYELFVDMVGQHYDNLWLYTKNITTKFDADNRLDYGISKDMVADAIRDFGVKLYSNNFNTNDLYTAFLGLTPSGSSFPFPYMTGSIGGAVDTPSGYEYVDSTISASNDIVPLDDVNKRLYKRIYHNIPYLLKTKGTVAGLRALITSYGIPDTILRINEFGGKDRNNSQDWDLKQDIYNVGLNTNSSGFTSSFSLNSDWGANENSPGSIQFRFKTNGIPSASNSPTTQSFFETDSTSTVAMGIEYNMSLLTEGNYSGSVPSKYKEYGTLKFWPNIDTNPTNYASLYLPFWDGDWWSVQVDRDISIGNDGGFILRAANKIGENIGFTGSDAIEGNTTPWESSTEIHWLPQNYTQFAGIYYFPFTGSLQEVRYYTEQLSESVFYDYAMNPYSFEGNRTNTAPDTLAFRLPLGSLLNTGSYKDSIHPKVTGSWVTTSSFNTNSSASFTSIPTWLNNIEDIHLDQTPSGMRNRVTDKIQTEALILPEGDTLSGYRSIQQTSYVSESFTPNVNYLEVAFSPQDQINDDIIGQMGYFNIGDYIGDPRLISSSDKSYPDLDLLRDAYFEKYITNYDVTDFVRLIKFFDNSLFKMIEDFTPARTSLSSGVVIKQHLLERNRQRPAQVTSSFHNYSGSVKNLPKNYSLGPGDYPQYSDSGSAIYKFGGGTAGSFEPFNSLKTTVSGSLGLGTDNRYFVTQSWEESWMTFSGSAPIDRSDQREFYNGEFSGSVIPVGINDICSAYFKLSNVEYRYVPVFWSADGYSNTAIISEQNFLDPINQPPPGYVWFWHNGENILYIKMSLQTYNGINIAPFIQNVEWIVFTFNSAVDYEGNILEGVQTFYLESVGIQPGNQASNQNSVGAALGYTIPEESSTTISSDDGAFYDFNFSASGDFQWYATQDTSVDPSPVLDTGISESVPQGYFPLTYHTESFFRGWASSNFYTNGTYNSYEGILSDFLDNFNTGSHEIDNTDSTVQSGIDPASNVPWFMNASNPQGSGKSWLQIPSESFLDYGNIPDSSVGPTSTNNYFNIAWTSASSEEPRAVQGTNYYYNSSNNAIYISGSEFQNEKKFLNPLYTSSLVRKLVNFNESTTSYTPYGQTSLNIPIDNSRGQELYVYQGESTSGTDTNAWRYNRYIHRPFKIYYLTETGSGQPGIPYDLYDPMVGGAGSGGIIDTVPVYYDNSAQSFATMLGTTGDLISRPNRDTYWRPLNNSETMPSEEAVSGSFQVFNETRQVRPFIFTTYNTVIPTFPGSPPARGSGSAVSISQSDGTPFATLRMYQNQTPSSPPLPTGNAFKLTCQTFTGCVVYYKDQNNTLQNILMTYAQQVPVCGNQNSNTTNLILPTSTGFINPSTNLSGLPDPCPSSPGGVDGGGQQFLGGDSNINLSPFFYKNPRPNGLTVGNTPNFSFNIPYGESFNGENTSSFSLQTVTQPGGNDENYEIVFPAGGYIFTMSDFDTTTFSNGRTEFGLYTTYGDYVSYDFENQDGSGANPATINYIDNQYEQTSIDVYEYAVQDADGGFTVTSNGNGTSNTDVRDYVVFTNQYSRTQYQRINIEVDGDYAASVSRTFPSKGIVRVYLEPNQSTTGDTPSGQAQELIEVPTTNPLTPLDIHGSLTNLQAGQQLFIEVQNTRQASPFGSSAITFSIFGLYNKSITNPNGIVALIGSPEAQGTFNNPYVVTGSIANRYQNGVEVPGQFATKVVDAYILYSSSLSSSLDGAYIFDVTPTFGILSVTASVVVSSFTDAEAALYGNAIYGEDQYGGGASGGGTTWTTASIILYTGSANNFPTEMPELGGNIFAQTSSFSLTHHTGERITLHAELSPTEIAYNDVLKMALRVGSGSNDPSVVENGLIVTEYSMSFSSSTVVEGDPSIPTIFSDDNNFETAYDCQPLLNNFSAGRLNNRLQDVDYNFGTVTPTNWQRIIDYSASRAAVPESNYSQMNVINGRYLGSKIASTKYNVWSPGDQGTYGKLPSIDINKNSLAYFNKLYDPYPLLNNKTIYNLQYLINDTGKVVQPKLSQIGLYDVQGNFEATPVLENGIVQYTNNAIVSLVGETPESLLPLQGEKPIFQIISRPTPILYSQKSGIFPLDKYSDEGIELIGNEPVDPNIFPTFNNYSFEAFGELINQVKSRTISITTQDQLSTVDPEDDGNPGPQNNVTASNANTGTSLPVYDTTSGFTTIPITDGNSENTVAGSPLVLTELLFSDGFTSNFSGGTFSGGSTTTISIIQGTDAATNAIVSGPVASDGSQAGVVFSIILEGTDGGTDWDITSFEASNGGSGNLVGTTFTISADAINAALDVGSAGTGNVVFIAQVPDLVSGGGFAFENTAGAGNNVSQPYELEFEFYVDMEPTVNKLRTRDHEGGIFGHSPIDEPNIAKVEVFFQKKNQYNSGDFGNAKIKSVDVDVIEYFASTNSTGQAQLLIPYSSAGAAYVSTNTQTGHISVTLNTNVIGSSVQNAGFSNPTLQRVRIKGKYNQAQGGGIFGGNSFLKQGNQFRLRYQGNIITNTSGNGPQFFPNGDAAVGGRMLLQGASDNPLTEATASFWEFSGSGAGKSTRVLVCAQPQLNKGYGRGFTQKDLVYTASFNKDFPVGREPYFSQMPPIELPWELQLNDEIRFENNEDYAYTIIKIVPPDLNEDDNLVVDGFPQLIIELDRDAPQSLENEKVSTDGGSGFGLSNVTSSAVPGEIVPSFIDVDFGQKKYRPLDFFVIRRYIEDAGSIIVNQKFPYNSNPQLGLTSAGFLSPPFTVPELETDPDIVLRDLVDKKLIE